LLSAPADLALGQQTVVEMISAGRRALIVAVAVAGTDLSVPPVNQQFAVLVTGDFSGSLDGLGLLIVDRSAALISGSADGPP
jgi:hypothetical protein